MGAEPAMMRKNMNPGMNFHWLAGVYDRDVYDRELDVFTTFTKASLPVCLTFERACSCYSNIHQPVAPVSEPVVN